MDVGSAFFGAALVIAALYANGRRRHEQRQRETTKQSARKASGRWMPWPHEDYSDELDEHPYRVVYHRSTQRVDR